jgi:hypothetical protein
MDTMRSGDPGGRCSKDIDLGTVSCSNDSWELSLSASPAYAGSLALTDEMLSHY